MINVVIIEDEVMIAELNQRYIAMLPEFNVFAMLQNGQDALEFIKKEKTNINLILLDVYMPNIDGLSLLAEMRALNINIEVIMITANSHSNDIKKALNLGIIDYLVKPFTFTRFKSALLTYLEKSRILSDNSQLDQSVLDQIIFHNKFSPKTEKRVKGIDLDTLAIVESVIKQSKGEFSINDIVDKVPLSRISLKKYINYLHDEKGLLVSRLEYLSVGRPVRIYKYK